MLSGRYITNEKPNIFTESMYIFSAYSLTNVYSLEKIKCLSSSWSSCERVKIESGADWVVTNYMGIFCRWLFKKIFPFKTGYIFLWVKNLWWEIVFLLCLKPIWSFFEGVESYTFTELTESLGYLTGKKLFHWIPIFFIILMATGFFTIRLPTI